MELQKFLSFDKMITPTIIKIIFYIGLIGSVIAGLVFVVQGITADFGGGVMVIMGLAVLLIGPFVVRIYCELLIVAFKIAEHLSSIKESLNTPIRSRSVADGVETVQLR